MDLHAATPAHPLDEPLPTELSGVGHGWFTRYRRYPVFSPAWVRGRLRLTGTVLVVVALLLAEAVADQALADWPWGALAQFAVHLFVPVLLTPWLACQVRLRGWRAPVEWRALLLVVAGSVAGLAAFDLWGAEPLKQWVAECVGAVNPDGTRKKVAVMVGVSVVQPHDKAAGDKAGDPAGTRTATSSSELANEAAAAPGRTAASAPAGGPLAPWNSADPQRQGTRTLYDKLSNLLIWGLIAYWLGGGSALSGWRRERAGLMALQRERELRHAQAERREAELKLSVLAAQVEPHFLFNTLAGVRSAISTDPARASEMVDRLVDYLRATIPRLRSDGSAETTLGGQLDMVRAYLGLMAARMTRLQYSVQAAPELLDAPCPPWMLISLVENAVRHGIEPKIGPARIDVSARRLRDGSLAISVADDGIGFGSSTSGSGLGLSNIRERLQQLYQGRASLGLVAGPAGGVIATITLPAGEPISAAAKATSTTSATSTATPSSALPLNRPAPQP
jgi:signal transduction histidine kinase